MSFFEVIS
uniref:Uncharacterized protein n=1 Tax=Arundo donax TaxID=35708 RepID=A0A0A9A4V4_ARUDO